MKLRTKTLKFAFIPVFCSLLVMVAIPGSAHFIQPEAQVSVTRDPKLPGFYKVQVSTSGSLSLDDALQWASDPIPTFIDQLTNIDESNADIGNIALRLARQFYPELDVGAYSAKIDQMADEVRKFVHGSTDPEVRIAALNYFLYKKLKISYDLDDPKAQKMKNRFLNGLIDTNKGSCATMPTLYLAIAQRLGYPIFPVLAPRHVFLRYVDPTLKTNNIEATSNGAFIADDEYQVMNKTNQKGIDSGSYFRTLSYKEFVGELIAENAFQWGAEHGGDIRRSIKYAQYSLKLNNKNPNAHRLMGMAYEALKKLAPEELKPFYEANVQYHRLAAEDLGLTFEDAPDDYYLKNAKKLAYYRQLKRSLGPISGGMQ